MEKYQFAVNYPSFLNFLTELSVQYPEERQQGLFAEIIKAAKIYKFPSNEVYELIAQSVLDKVESDLHRTLPKSLTTSDMSMMSSLDLGKERRSYELINYINNVLRPYYETEKVTCHNLSAVADCDQWVCSHCGINLTEWTKVVVDEEENDTTYHEYCFKFCPECGHKVVSRYDE